MQTQEGVEGSGRGVMSHRQEVDEVLSTHALDQPSLCDARCGPVCPLRGVHRVIHSHSAGYWWPTTVARYNCPYISLIKEA